MASSGRIKRNWMISMNTRGTGSAMALLTSCKITLSLRPMLRRIVKRQSVRRTRTVVHLQRDLGVNLAGAALALSAIADRDDVEVLCPVHPNPAVRGPVERALAAHPSVHLTKPKKIYMKVFVLPQG